MWLVTIVNYIIPLSAKSVQAMMVVQYYGVVKEV